MYKGFIGNTCVGRESFKSVMLFRYWCKKKEGAGDGRLWVERASDLSAVLGSLGHASI